MTAILIDGNNCLYRFGHALSGLRSSEGVATGAIHGTLSCMARLKAKYPDARFVMVWDGFNKRETWRSKLFPGYKQNRTVPPIDSMTAEQQKKQKEKATMVASILNQEKYLGPMLTDLGVTQIRVDYVEADDLIGLLAYKMHQCYRQAVVYSSDKDFMQLMPLDVHVIRDVDKKKRLLPESDASAYTAFRCKAVDILKVRAIAGDSSDGIPGVLPGVSTVRASVMVNAGINPMYETWAENSKASRSACLKLKDVWSDVHRNYRLMRIPFMLDDSEIPHRLHSTVNAELKIATDVVLGDTRVVNRVKSFLSTASDLDLHEIIRNRAVFYKFCE